MRWSHPPRSAIWSATVKHHHAAAVVAAVVMAVATGMGAEEEAGTEHNGDDEYDAGGDAHPRERLHQAAWLVLGGRGDHGCRSCCDGLRRGHWFGRRSGGCFSHDMSMRALLRC
ncbi:hypothetical protein QQ25_29070 [Mycolicibacterium setense]|nr:hypothetical protein QQ25_29070 [Mycolicibacterium setense]